MAIVNKKRAEDAAKLEAEASPDVMKDKSMRQKDRKNKQGTKAGKNYNQNGTSQVR